MVIFTMGIAIQISEKNIIISEKDNFINAALSAMISFFSIANNMSALRIEVYVRFLDALFFFLPCAM